MQPQALPGFRDFYPADLAFRAHIFDTWRTVAGRYGFEEWDGPPLEPLELYTAKSGDEIVGQLYSFRDKGDREVSLRPEMTPTLARVVAARANGLRKPIRWFSIPQLFRYERQQRGRLREHFQLNCDLIGEPGPLADAEIIALAIDLMRAFGLGPEDVRVRVSDRQLLEAVVRTVGATQGQMPAIFGVIDKIERTERKEVCRRLVGIGLTESASERLIEMLACKDLSEIERELDKPIDAVSMLSAGRMEAGPLKQAVAALDQMGLADFVELDLKIVRGLAYYTGTVFELFDAKGELRAICGGGRYDNLLNALGGVDLPAVGFGMGDVVLGELLRDRGLIPPPPASIEVFVAGITPDDQPHVLRAAHRLRDAGFRVEFALSQQAIGKQLKLADARSAAVAVVIGPDDRARGEVQLKDLRQKGQRAVKEAELVEEVRRALH